MHRGGLSLVPGESRPASGRRGARPTAHSGHAGPLRHATSGLALGLSRKELGLDALTVSAEVAVGGTRCRRGRLSREGNHDAAGTANPQRLTPTATATATASDALSGRCWSAAAALPASRPRWISRRPGSASTWSRKARRSAAAWRASTRPSPPATAPPASFRRSWWSACATTTSTC